MKEPVRILLSETSSRYLLEVGECFIVGGKSSHPEIPGRIVLHLLPIPMKQAADACLVAMGQARAVKPRMPKPARESATRAPAPAREASPDPAGQNGGTTP